MNLILLNSTLSSSETFGKTLPVITLKQFVKKRPRPELERYQKKQDIEGCDQILIAKSLKFLQKKYTPHEPRVPIFILPPIKQKNKTIPSTLAKVKPKIIKKKSLKKKKKEKTTWKATTPEPNIPMVSMRKGENIGRVIEEDEPKKLCENLKSFYLPEVVLIKPNVYEGHEGTLNGFMLVQEDMDF